VTQGRAAILAHGLVLRLWELARGTVRMQRYDVIVIGAGHNGLISAAYLAKAGMSVCVCERNEQPGGSLINLEFMPGFVGSAGAHTIGLMNPRVFRDLDLGRKGLDIIPMPGRVTPTGSSYVATYANLRQTQADIARYSVRDSENFPNFLMMLERQRRLIDPLMTQGVHHPFNARKNTSSGMSALNQEFRRMGEGAGEETAEFWLSSCKEVLDRYFETEALKAHLVAPALIG
jgi:phytoene dehydrogenase-like protein